VHNVVSHTHQQAATYSRFTLQHNECFPIPTTAMLTTVAHYHKTRNTHVWGQLKCKR